MGFRMNGFVIAFLGYVVSASLLLAAPPAKANDQVCAPVPTDLPYLKEVPLESLKDAAKGAYELEWAQIQVVSHFKTGLVRSAHASIRPTAKGFVSNVECLSTSDLEASTPVDDLTLLAPLTIDASTLALSGWVEADINIKGNVLSQEIQTTPIPQVATLANLKETLKSEGEVRVYKTDEGRIELRAKRTRVRDQGPITIFTRHIFSLQPKGV